MRGVRSAQNVMTLMTADEALDHWYDNCLDRDDFDEGYADTLRAAVRNEREIGHSRIGFYDKKIDGIVIKNDETGYHVATQGICEIPTAALQDAVQHGWSIVGSGECVNTVRVKKPRPL